MERDEETKKMLDQALSAGDDWLRKQGVITDFSINTIIAWVYLNFQKVENVEMDVDRPKQRIYMRIYLGFWTLVWMTFFRQKDQFIDTVFAWLTDYLPTYEVSVELKRWRGGSREKFTVDTGDDTSVVANDELSESEGNIAQALRDSKDRPKGTKDSTNADVPTAQATTAEEPSISDGNSQGDSEGKS